MTPSDMDCRHWSADTTHTLPLSQRMKIASWNVNSLRVRLSQVLAWIETATPDILCLQETKLPDERFPVAEFENVGYYAVYHGQAAYNGVAIVARIPPAETQRGLPNLEDNQARCLAATLGQLRIVNVYVPNGQAVDADAYRYKLRWLAALASFVGQELAVHPELLVLGDYNIAPTDRDVYDPQALAGAILCSAPEREALAHLEDLGLRDIFRHLHPQDTLYSWWDYRAGMFRRNLGLRIDLILVSSLLLPRCVASGVDREARRAARPSDHAPVWVELDA